MCQYNQITSNPCFSSGTVEQMKYSKLSFVSPGLDSLRTADVFLVVASRERSDDRKSISFALLSLRKKRDYLRSGLTHLLKWF